MATRGPVDRCADCDAENYGCECASCRRLADGKSCNGSCGCDWALQESHPTDRARVVAEREVKLTR